MQDSAVPEEPNAQGQLPMKSAVSFCISMPPQGEHEFIVDYLERVVNAVLLLHRRKAGLEDTGDKK